MAAATGGGGPGGRIDAGRAAATEVGTKPRRRHGAAAREKCARNSAYCRCKIVKSNKIARFYRSLHGVPYYVAGVHSQQAETRIKRVSAFSLSRILARIQIQKKQTRSATAQGKNLRVISRREFSISKMGRVKTSPQTGLLLGAAAFVITGF